MKSRRLLTLIVNDSSSEPSAARVRSLMSSSLRSPTRRVTVSPFTSTVKV